MEYIIEFFIENLLAFALILIAFMFFVAVVIRGWPEHLRLSDLWSSEEESSDGVDVIEELDGKYITLERESLEFDRKGIPEKIQFKVRITEYKL
jgi:hypothetical protein